MIQCVILNLNGLVNQHHYKLYKYITLAIFKESRCAINNKKILDP